MLLITWDAFDYLGCFWLFMEKSIVLVNRPKMLTNRQLAKRPDTEFSFKVLFQFVNLNGIFLWNMIYEIAVWTFNPLSMLGSSKECVWRQWQDSNIYIQKQPGSVMEKKKTFFNIMEDEVLVCWALINMIYLYLYW